MAQWKKIRFGTDGTYGSRWKHFKVVTIYIISVNRVYKESKFFQCNQKQFCNCNNKMICLTEWEVYKWTESVEAIHIH